MLRSMFSAISGLRAHQTMMDVIGNNIANVNTVGFKGSQTVFQDTLCQMIRRRRRAGGGPRRHQPGPGRPRRPGRRDHHELHPGRDPDHRPLDRLHDPGRRLLRHPRRAPSSSTPAPGRSTSTATGKLVTPDGGVLQGWMADAAGVVNTNGPIGDLTVPYGQLVNPADHDRGARRQPAADAADRRHAARPASRCTTARASRRRCSTTSPRPRRPTPGTSTSSTTNGDAALVTGATVAFNAAGALTTPAAPARWRPFTPAGRDVPGWTGPVTDRRLPKLTQFGGAEHRRRARAGRLRARLAAVLPARQRRHDHRASTPTAAPADRPARPGHVHQPGRPGEGRQLDLPRRRQLRRGRTSALAGVGGRGVAHSGALEMSNVDLAEEFTGLIVAQRGFQANSRVITTSDEILQDLVNLKR